MLTLAPFAFLLLVLSAFCGAKSSQAGKGAHCASGGLGGVESGFQFIDALLQPRHLFSSAANGDRLSTTP